MNTNEIPKEDLKEFLKELSKLTRKHNITIGGCGCCGSPFLMRIKKVTSGKYVCSDDCEGLSWKDDSDE